VNLKQNITYSANNNIQQVENWSCQNCIWRETLKTEQNADKTV